MDLLRYTVESAENAERRLAAALEESAQREERAEWMTLVYLIAYGLGCACLGAIAAFGWMLGGHR